MVLEHSRDGAVAILTLAYPPANALGLTLRRALHEFFDSVRHDATVQAVVVRGAGKGFCAGGDRAEFGTEAADARPTLSRDVLDAIERCGRPVVAALHGYAVGGGFELALACDARVAHAMTRIALPEVGIGLFPLSATQRLPRLLGLGCAADIMLAGEVLRADAPSLSPCFDRIVTTDDALMESALGIARAAVTTAPRPVRTRAIPGDPAADLARLLARHPPHARTAAQQALLDAVEAAVRSPTFAAGLERAQQLFDRLGGTRRPSPPIRPG